VAGKLGMCVQKALGFTQFAPSMPTLDRDCGGEQELFLGSGHGALRWQKPGGAQSVDSDWVSRDSPRGTDSVESPPSTFNNRNGPQHQTRWALPGGRLVPGLRNQAIRRRKDTTTATGTAGDRDSLVKGGCAQILWRG
jgi:hypothetical protein